MDNLKKDDEVVISIMEHHSNLVPWQKVTKVTDSKLNYMYINEEFEISKFPEISELIFSKLELVAIVGINSDGIITIIEIKGISILDKLFKDINPPSE